MNKKMDFLKDKIKREYSSAVFLDEPACGLFRRDAKFKLEMIDSHEKWIDTFGTPPPSNHFIDLLLKMYNYKEEEPDE